MGILTSGRNSCLWLNFCWIIHQAHMDLHQEILSDPGRLVWILRKTSSEKACSLNQFEPVSDWGRKQFAQFASLSRKVAGHWEKASAARAKLANRYRRTLELKVGDRVVWQSPQARPEGAGRVPWKRGLSGPWEVTEVRGHKLTLKLVHDPTSRSVEAHAEDCVLIPEDLEVRPS